MNGLPNLALAPNPPRTTTLAPEIRVTISHVTQDDDGRFRWTVSVEEDKVITLRRCRTNRNGAGLEVANGPAWWLMWLRPDEFSLADIHPIHRRDHALEGFLTIDMDF